MKVVNVKDFTLIKQLNKGTFSKVYIVDLDGKKYCYKEFVHSYADDKSIVKLCDLTDEDFKSQYIVPKYMVYSSGRSLFTGYLSNYDPDLVSIFNPFSREEKIKLLKSVKENIEILHSEYNLIHGDLHLKNILCHKSLLESSIIDFDFAQRIGDIPSTYVNYGLALQDYVKYNPFDYNADKYYFNLSTLKLLAEITEDYENTMEIIKNDQFYFSEINSDVKRLAKELILDSKRSYNGEYIIDYIA